MKRHLTPYLFLFSFLAACNTTPVPYKVSKIVDGPSTLPPINFPLGITQEKLDKNKYRITAKLNEVGTVKRSYHMALYHAAILAEEHNVNSFFVNQKLSPSWCQSLKQMKTLNVVDVTGGPTTKLTVTLINTKPNLTKRNLFSVEDVKKSSKLIIDEKKSDAELEKISDERHEHCYKKASKRTNKSRIQRQKVINQRKAGER